MTAELARSYKPALAGFELAFETIDVPRERILHVAQSLFHDHVPAKQLGLDLRLDRPAPRPAGGGRDSAGGGGAGRDLSEHAGVRGRGQRAPRP